MDLFLVELAIPLTPKEHRIGDGRPTFGRILRLQGADPCAPLQLQEQSAFESIEVLIFCFQSRQLEVLLDAMEKFMSKEHVAFAVSVGSGQISCLQRVSARSV